jgi:hypothetical protein
MQQADALGALMRRERQPVPRPKDGGDKAHDDTSDGIPDSSGGKTNRASDVVPDIEDDGHRQQIYRENDQYEVNRTPKRPRSAFHWVPSLRLPLTRFLGLTWRLPLARGAIQGRSLKASQGRVGRRKTAYPPIASHEGAGILPNTLRIYTLALDGGCNYVRRHSSVDLLIQ